MKKHIFLIDDDEQELQSFMQAFNDSQIPFRCTYINNIQHATNVLQFLKPDIIFLELSSPAIDGLKCLQVIRRVDNARKTPVAVYSYLFDEQMFNHAMEAGATLCFRKPYHANGLKDKVAEILTMNWSDESKESTPFLQEADLDSV